MSEEQKETYVQSTGVTAQTDPSRTAAETATRVVYLQRLFDTYTAGMTDTQKQAYSLAIKGAYEYAKSAGLALSDDEIFSQTKALMMGEQQQPQQQEKPEESPLKGKVEVQTAAVAPAPQVELDGDNPLADDETYLRTRLRLYNSQRTLISKGG